MRELSLNREEALRVMRNYRGVDLYMGAHLVSWSLTHGHGSVSSEVVDQLLRTGNLARKWAEMPCYYCYGDQSIEKVVRRQDEVLIPAVRDATLALAMAEYRHFLRREEEAQRQQAAKKKALAAEKRNSAPNPGGMNGRG